MPTATLTSKGQLTIPKEVREALAVEAGDLLDFLKEADGTFRVEARKIHVGALAGILRRKGQRRVSERDMDAAIARGRTGTTRIK